MRIAVSTTERPGTRNGLGCDHFQHDAVEYYEKRVLVKMIVSTIDCMLKLASIARYDADNVK